MKFFILGLVVLMFASVGRSAPLSYRYLQESAPMLRSITTMIYWMRHFPASDATPTPIHEFMAEEVSVSSQEELTQMSEEDKLKLAERVNDRRAQWFDEYYPQPTEERVVEVLSEDDDLRARMVAFAWTMQTELIRNSGRQLVGLNELFPYSFGLAMFIKAIDADMTEKELDEKITRFIGDKVLDVKYRGEGNKPYVKGRSNSTYRSLDRYLIRVNSVNHPQLPSDVQGDLWMRGYNDLDQYGLFPVNVARKFIEQEFSPDRVEAAGYDLALLIDLLCERCIIGNFIPTILDAEAASLDELVAAEVGLDLEQEAGKEAFAAIIALINDKDNPASLFQIVQLERLGFSLEKIAELNYHARDAIIVSAHLNRKSFVKKHGDDIDEINQTAEEVGELAFYLQNRGYVRSIEEIKPHQAPLAQDIEDIVKENINWQSIMPGNEIHVPIVPKKSQD